MRRSWSLLILVAAMLGGLLQVERADAATRTWSGASSAAWSDPGNWDTLPVAGDDLVFPGGSTIVNTTTTNDFPAGTTFHSITIGGAYTISGNAIVLDAGGLQIANLGFPSFTTTIGLAITLAANQTWSANTVTAGSPTLTQPIALNGRTLTIDSRYDFHIAGVISGSGVIVKNSFGNLFLDAANTYAGPTTINEGGVVASTPTSLGVADGTLANGTLVNGSLNGTGRLLIAAGVTIGNEAVSLGTATSEGDLSIFPIGSNGLASFAGSIVLNGSATLGLVTVTGPVSGSGPMTANGVTLTNSANSFTTLVRVGALTVGGNEAIPAALIVDLSGANPQRLTLVPGVTQTLAGLTGVGDVIVPETATLRLNDTTDVGFEGRFVGAGTVQHIGAGHLSVSSSGGPLASMHSTLTGPFIIDHGNVTLDRGGTLPGPVTVNADGRLSFRTRTSRPGPPTRFEDPPTAGSVTSHGGRVQLVDAGSGVVAGAFSLDNTSTFEVDAVANTLTGLVVRGDVTLGDATLALPTSGFTPPNTSAFTLIFNLGSHPINGTFKNLPEGAIIGIPGQRFQISYVGGTGHDVVVTAVDYFLSEGATSAFFTTDLLLANPNGTDAPVEITYLLANGITVPGSLTLPAHSQHLIRVNDIPGMESQFFSTIVHSVNGTPLIVERTMSWDRSSYGAHTEHAVEGASTTWYFAEGSQGFFHTYLLLVNPEMYLYNLATVQYLREDEPPLVRSYGLPPTSRYTVDAATDPELANRSFGMIVTFTRPGGAERAMYFGDAPLFNGGHDSAGATAPSTTWFLAEGATGPFFETFILLANPGDVDATVTLTYLTSSGTPVMSTKTVPAHRRLTINLETESPALANAAVSTLVSSTQPILAERSQYWPDPAPNWYEAHNSFGVTTLGTSWGLAEGRVGDVDGFSGAQTYILLANPGSVETVVSITFLRDNGAAPVVKNFTVPPMQRFNVTVGPGTDVPELANEHFGATITSDHPIAVERAVYWNANGQIWAAGTNATATKLP